MKAEQRHKLETNVMADWIGQTLKSIEPYYRTIIVAAVLVLVAVGAAVALPKYWAHASAAAWDEFYSASTTGNLGELERIAEENAGTSVAHWALVVAADERLTGACLQLFADKFSSAQELRKAIEDYTKVIDQSRETQLRERALFGRARAYEAISGTRQGAGELPQAIADYERVVEGWPEGPYAAMAREQITALKSPDVKSFYDKFAAYAPRRPVSKEAGAAGKLIPFDASSLPDQASESEFSKLLNLGDLKVRGPKGEAEKPAPEKPGPGKGEPAKPEPLKTEPPKPPKK